MLDFLENQGSLEEFLKRHVKPYDPATDEYRCPAYGADIKSGERTPYYNFHYYHTKVPPEVICELIRHYTYPGDVVLDPFSGSGMTGLAALLADYEEFRVAGNNTSSCPRTVILNDLSPAACHIAINYNNVVDTELVSKEFTRIVAKLMPELSQIYSVEHYEPAFGVYDPHNPEVGSHLKSEPARSRSLIDDLSKADWELLSRDEVEMRLGYPVSELSYCDKEGLQAKQWIAIPATMHYTVWSDVFNCQGFVSLSTPTGRRSTRGSSVGVPIVKKTKVSRGCGGLINLWECAVEKSTGKVLDSFVCPHCKQVWTKVQLFRSHSEPVSIAYRFEGLKTLKKGITGAQLSRTRPISRLDKRHFAEITKLPITETFEDEPVDTGREMMRHGLLKRGVQRISDFYTHRNLYGLSLLWNEILSVSNKEVRYKLQFCFTSQVMRASRLRRMRPFGPGEQLSGTLYISALTVETNVLNLLSHAVSQYCETFPRWMLHFPHHCFVRTGSAIDFVEIPDDSIDFIFTDPPFGKNIFYSDCAMLWEGWLRDKTDEKQEIVVNERRVGGNFKTVEDYGQLMEYAFREMFRILKPGRYAVVEFNNSDGTVFDVVKRAIAGAGFHIQGMFVFDKGVKTFKQNKGSNEGEAVVDKDVMFTLIKPRMDQPKRTSDFMDLEQQVAEAVRQHLTILPDRIQTDPSRYSDDHRTTSTINSILMNVLILRGVSVDRLNLPYIERVCSRYFRKVGQHWYLRGEVVNGSNGSNGVLIREEIAVKDEVSAIEWLRQKIQVRPMLVGELKPLWMRATGLLHAEVSQQLDLEVLLRENFWQDLESKRWREPTEEERELMNDSQTLRVLHDVERFLAGSLKRQVSDTDRCEWIEAIFRACRAVEEQEGEELPALRDFDPVAGYRMISQLFHGVLSDHVPAAVFGRVEKQARVAASRLREGIEPDKTGKKSRESKNQLELEL